MDNFGVGRLKNAAIPAFRPSLILPYPACDVKNDFPDLLLELQSFDG
jgi:hypothetical protein